MGKLKTIGITTSITLTLAVIAAGGVYFWQHNLLTKNSSDYEDQISSMRSDLAAARAQTQATPTPTATPAPTKPPVVYTGDGAAKADAEKKEIEAKLVAPYIDFHNGEGQSPTASLLITIPTKKGDPITVVAIGKTGGQYESFSFGKKGDTSFAWWAPTCVGGCVYSEAFKTAYPEVVKKAPAK